MTPCNISESYNVSNPHGQYSVTYKAPSNAYYFVYPYFSVSGSSSDTYVLFQASVNGNAVYTSTFYTSPKTYIDLGYITSGSIITTNIQMYGPGNSVFYKIYICYSSTESPPPPPTTSTSTSRSTTPPPPTTTTHHSSSHSTTTSSSPLSQIILPLIIATVLIMVAVLVAYLSQKKK